MSDRLIASGLGTAPKEPNMTISEDQTRQAEAMISDNLQIHHSNKVAFQSVKAKTVLDLDNEEYLNIQVIYDGEPNLLDPGLLKSFHRVILEPLRNLGIHARPSISYIHQSEAHQLSI